MFGSIKLTLYEVVDIPMPESEGEPKRYVIKARVGSLEHVTSPQGAFADVTPGFAQIRPFKAEFTFPVENGRQLMVLTLNDADTDEQEGELAIKVSTILEKNAVDRMWKLEGNGTIHAKAEFSLSEEEKIKLAKLRMLKAKKAKEAEAAAAAAAAAADPSSEASGEQPDAPPATGDAPEDSSVPNAIQEPVAVPDAAPVPAPVAVPAVVQQRSPQLHGLNDPDPDMDPDGARGPESSSSQTTPAIPTRIAVVRPNSSPIPNVGPSGWPKPANFKPNASDGAVAAVVDTTPYKQVLQQVASIESKKKGDGKSDSKKAEGNSARREGEEDDGPFNIPMIWKQIAGGLAVVVGLVLLWPKKPQRPKPVARSVYIVNEGDTLAGLIPEHYCYPDTNFYLLNEELCERNYIIEGQKIYLP